jgi:hypothetical protein
MHVRGMAGSRKGHHRLVWHVTAAVLTDGPCSVAVMHWPRAGARL